MFKRRSGIYHINRVPGSSRKQIFICFLMACLVGVLISLGFAIWAVGRFSPTPANRYITPLQPTPTPEIIVSNSLTTPKAPTTTTMPTQTVNTTPRPTTTTPFNPGTTKRGEQKCPENEYVASDGNVFSFEKDAMEYLKKTRIPFKGYRFGPRKGIPCARIYMFDVYAETFEY